MVLLSFLGLPKRMGWMPDTEVEARHRKAVDLGGSDTFWYTSNVAILVRCGGTHHSPAPQDASAKELLEFRVLTSLGNLASEPWSLKNSR